MQSGYDAVASRRAAAARGNLDGTASSDEERAVDHRALGQQHVLALGAVPNAAPDARARPMATLP